MLGGSLHYIFFYAFQSFSQLLRVLQRVTIVTQIHLKRTQLHEHMKHLSYQQVIIM